MDFWQSGRIQAEAPLFGKRTPACS